MWSPVLVAAVLPERVSAEDHIGGLDCMNEALADVEPTRSS